MAKKNVLLVVSNLRGGGMERVASIVTFLLKDTYHVKMVILDDKNKKYDIACEYRAINIENKNAFDKVFCAIRRIIAVRKIKKEWDIDISLSFGFGGSSEYVNVFSARRDKIFLSMHGYSTVKPPTKFVAKMLRHVILSKAHTILCVSKKMVAAAQENYPKHREKFKPLYNPYETHIIAELKKEPLSNYQQLFDNHQVIIAAGTHKREKGYWHLVKAFSEAKKEYPDIKLLILGRADGERDKRNKEQLEALIASLGLVDDVILGGFEENPFRYISRSAMFVLSSVSEGFPNVLAESMACGIPVVAVDCNTGPREMLSEGNPLQVATGIEHQDYGLLVPPMTAHENYDASDIEACDVVLAEAIKRYLGDKELATDYARKAQIGVSRFTQDVFKETLIERFEF